LPTRILAVCVLMSAAPNPDATAQPSSRSDDEWVSTAALAAANLNADWTLSLSLATAEQIRGSRVVDDALYVWTSHGSLYGLDRHRGLVRWSQRIDAAARFPLFGPTHVDRASGGRLTAVVTFEQVILLDSYDGQPAGVVDLDFVPTSAAAGLGSTLYLGGADRMVHAVQWCPTCPGGSFERWRVLSGGSVRATPIVVPPGVIFYASDGGQMVSATALDKRALWGQRLPGPVNVDMVPHADGLYVTGDNASIYRFDPRNGALRQRIRLPARLISAPLRVDDDLFALAVDGALYCVDPLTDEIRWRRPGTTALLAVQDSAVAIQGASRELVLVNRSDGRDLARVEVNRVDHFVANRVDDSVYLLGARGRVLAARPAGAGYQRAADVADAARRRHDVPAPMASDGSNGGLAAEQASRADQDPLRSRSTLPTLVSQTPPR